MTREQPAGWTRVAAYALASDAAGRILLVRIAPGYPAAGEWTLPGGGLNFGEDPAVAAVRELAEETGLDGTVEGLEFVHSASGAESVRGGPWHAIRIVYRVRVTGGTLRDEHDESSDRAEWFSLADARRLPLVDLARAALQHLEAG